MSLKRTKRLKAFFKLVRLDYSLFSALGVFMSRLLVSETHFPNKDLIVAFFIVFFTATGSFALNDYYDFESDEKNNRYDRPLVAGLLSKNTALISGCSSLSLSISLTLFTNDLSKAIVFLSLPIFLLYNIYLKRLYIIKNVVIAYAFVATILLGAVTHDSTIEPLTAYFATMGFIVGLAFEIMSDIDDVKGDTARGVTTLASRLGIKKASRISSLLYGVITFLDPLPFFLPIDPRLNLDLLFLGLITIPVISYLLNIKKLILDPKTEIAECKRNIFITMQIGCIAYLIGVLI
jgi:4-hydroxybenzoate polyprenyltransferase